MADRLQLAKKVCTKAGKKVLTMQSKLKSIKTKGRIDDFVTDADLASEKIIVNAIKKNFPADAIVSEEGNGVKMKANYVWVVDPLDGTTVYAAGMPTYAISVGLLYKNMPLLGVVNLPAFSSLYWAQKGKGAHHNNQKIKVSQKSDLINCIVGADLKRMNRRVKEFNRVSLPLFTKVRAMPILGSAVLGTTFVAHGIYDAYVHDAHPWDYVASAIIIQEAGGKITDYKGKAIRDWLKNRLEIIASNGIIHKKIVSQIKQ